MVVFAVGNGVLGNWVLLLLGGSAEPCAIIAAMATDAGSAWVEGAVVVIAAEVMLVAGWGSRLGGTMALGG
jgi:hypothetical protein